VLTAGEFLSHPQPLRKKRNDPWKARREAIYEAFMAGKTQRLLALEYGLSVQRVKEIVRNERYARRESRQRQQTYYNDRDRRGRFVPTVP
jgi:Mor family transcriptional regulator